jgi:fluoride exporter
MSKLLLVFLGGGLGACARWLLATTFNTAGLSPQGFPWGTLGVNLLGCLLIGLAAGLFERTNAPAEWGLFFITGVLGGFTTFSSFGLETVRLLRGNQLALALAYVSASNILGISWVAAGYTLSRV